MPTTVYDVSTRYSLQTQGSGELQKLGASADGAWSSLSRLGGLMAGGMAFGAGKKALIDANSEMEALRATMAQSISLNFQIPFERSADAAAEMVDRFQQLAKASPGTTREFAQIGNAILGPVVRAKGTLDDVVKLTQGVMLAKGPLLQWDEAARDIESAVNGTLNARDRFARSVLEPRGLDATKFNALSQEQRRKTLVDALQDPAILAYGKAVENSWAGAVSTLEDNLTITLQHVGLPLFKQLTGEVVTWNQWIEKNGATMEQWTKTAADYLMRGFGVAKDAVAFIVDNGDTLITIAKVWAAAQGISAIGGAASGIGGLVGGLGKVGGMLGGGGKLAMESALLAEEMGAVATAGGGAATGLAGLAGPVGLAVAAIGAFTVALEAGRRVPGGVYDRKEQLDNIGRSLDVAQMKSLGENATKAAVFDWARQAGALNTSGDNEGLNRAAFMERLIALGEKDGERITKLADMAERVLGTMSWEEWDKRLGRAAEAKAEDPMKKAGKPHNGMNVTIQRIEVASDDPDRFVHQLKSALQRAARNPSSARTAIAGAF